MKKTDWSASIDDNNFNLLRLLTAFMILFYHCYPLSLGPNAVDPVSKAIHFQLGTVGVFSFMVISGFLVTRSFYERKSILSFLVARVLRIYPAVIGSVLFCVLIVGLFFTPLAVLNYLRHPETIRFLANNMSLKMIVYNLPRVFEENPYPYAVNGSLWILPYLLRLYLIVMVLGLLTILNRKVLFNSLFLLFCALCLFAPQGILFSNPYWRTWPFAFFSGSFIYLNRSAIPMDKRIFLGLACLSLMLIPWHASLPLLYQAVFQFTLSYAVIFLAYIPRGRIRKFNTFGDYSYGLYVYAFPVQQCCVALIPGIQPLQLFLPSVLAALFLAFLSWHGIEKHALKQKARLSDLLRNGVRRVPLMRKTGRGANIRDNTLELRRLERRNRTPFPPKAPQRNACRARVD
jgi:peptidoglycan/LPS O-acetylase OafA/YrhL